MKELIFINPIFKEMVWGGNRLKKEFNYNIPSEQTGECWAISAHKNGDCTVSSKSFDGMKLSELWANHKELFGSKRGDRFPLLIKIIDAKEDLSIQVHPDDEYARKNENGSLGKTECWYILECDENASIVVGHNAKDKEELKEMIHENRWNELIRKIPIKKGDFFQIEPGTVHAIKGGTVILETQQNSDITYRLYDYDRISNGALRELHIDKSIDVITCPYLEKKVEQKTTNLEHGTMEELITCEYYTVKKLTLNGNEIIEQKEEFTLISVIEGTGKIDGTDIKKGDHLILPNGYGDYKLEGQLELSISNC
jgi:mannose-6-phosphate isomerase class I